MVLKNELKRNCPLRSMYVRSALTSDYNADAVISEQLAFWTLSVGFILLSNLARLL